MSKRQDRKDTRAAAHKLRNDPAWAPPTGNDPMEKLMKLDQEVRDDRVFGEAAVCEACSAERASTGDETALCATHLAEVMGF